MSGSGCTAVRSKVMIVAAAAIRILRYSEQKECVRNDATQRESLSERVARQHLHAGLLLGYSYRETRTDARIRAEARGSLA